MLPTANLEAAQLHFQAGNTLKDKGQIAEAIHSYQKALALQPDLAVAHLALAQVLLSQNRLDEALQTIAKVQALQPELISADLYLQLGQIFSDRGNLDTAAHYFQQAIVLQPGQATAYLSLGHILLRQGEVIAAINHYQQAISLQPDLAMAHWHLSLALQQQATAHQQTALDLEPSLLGIDAHFEMGIRFAEQQQLDWARRAYQRAILLRPDWAEAHCNLGNVFSAQSQLDEAIRSFQRAIALKPDLIEAYSNLGNTLVLQEKFDQAIPYHQQAIQLNPTWAELHYNLGDALVKQGRFQDAIPCFQEAIQLKPLLAEAHFALGKLLLEQSQLDAAVRHLQQTIQLKPNWPEAHYQLGKALSAQGLSEAAIQQYLQTITLAPELIAAYWDLGVELWHQDRGKEAIECFQRILDQQPHLADIHQNLCVLLRTGGDFVAARQATDRYAQFCGETDPIRVAVTQIKVYLESGLYSVAQAHLPTIEARCESEVALSDRETKLVYEDLLFSLPYLRDDVKANTQLCRLVGHWYTEQCIPPVLPGKPKAKPKSSARKRTVVRDAPLRIGIISKHFRRHSVGWCSRAIIQELSQLTPHLHLYFTARGAADDVTDSFRQMTNQFYYWPERCRDRAFNPAELIEQLWQDELDILIDMDSLMNPVHAAILHHRPASACFSWLGCEAPFISEKNYYLCDWHTHPIDVDPHYREQLVRMPDFAVAVAGFESLTIDRDASRSALGVGPDQVIYLSVATGHKVNPDTIKAQVSLLQQVPGSLLIHKGFADSQVLQALYQEECLVQGVDAQRCKFISRQQTEEEHRTIYQIADVLLDTYPYNGGTHNLEALWFNLPIVTHVGKQGPARLGYSFLKAVGITEGIAWNWDEYISWGVCLGQDTTLRQALRDKLIQSKQPETRSPLWSPQKFARDAYALFKTVLEQPSA